MVKQLYHPGLGLLSLHLRPIVSPQTGFHVSLRSSPRIHYHLPLTAIPVDNYSTVCLRRVRHLHPAHQENLPGLQGHRELGQIER